MPDDFFHGIAYLIPGLNQVAQKCGISIGEWIILWDLQHQGVLDGEGQPVMLRQELTQSLSNRGFGDANITRLLNTLGDKGHVQRMSLTQIDREKLFGSSERETRLAVVLQPSGDKKINEFKERLILYVEKWRHSERPVIPAKTFEAATTTLVNFAGFLKNTGAESK